ncbi:MAG TPA: TolC family protein [Candidatus Eisenbacteria bacterium]
MLATAVAMAGLFFSSAALAADAPPTSPSGEGVKGAAIAAAITANPDSALAQSLAAIEGTPLTLGEAVQATLEGSTDVRSAEAAYRAARGAARRERGAFDPELFASTTWSEADEPSASFFAGASVLRIRQTVASGGARVTLPLGTELSATLDATRYESNSSFDALKPQYDAATTLSLRQPLLRGFGPGAWGERAATGREVEAAKARYDDAVMAARAAVEQTYWDLYAAERDLAVQRLIRDQAGALLEQAVLRNKAGLVGPNQVANARVFYAEQVQAVIDREESLDKTSDQLASIIGRRPAGEATRYRPADEPPSDFPIAPEDSLVAHAVSRNNDLKARERAVAAARSRWTGARWNAYPQLDVFGSMGGNGLAGRPQDVVFNGQTFRTNVSGGFGDAFAQARDRKFPTWSAGVEVSIPIGFREGAGERDRLHAETDRAEQDLIAARRSLSDRVRAGHRELVYASRRLEAARAGVAASQEQVRIGIVEYANGRTTAFELVRLGADLASAQQRYSQALVRTAKAAAELRLLTSGDYPSPAGTGGN